MSKINFTMSVQEEMPLIIDDIRIGDRGFDEFCEANGITIDKDGGRATPVFTDVFKQRYFEPMIDGEVDYIAEPDEPDVNYRGGIVWERFNGDLFVGDSDDGENIIDLLEIPSITFHVAESEDNDAQTLETSEFIRKWLQSEDIEITARQGDGHPFVFKLSIDKQLNLTGRDFSGFNTSELLAYFEGHKEDDAWELANNYYDDRY